MLHEYVPDKKYIWVLCPLVFCLKVGQQMTKRLITFKVTDSMIKWMIEMEASGNYSSRSELVRDALEEFLARENFEGEKTYRDRLKEKEQLNRA